MSSDFHTNRHTTRLQNWNYNWRGLYFVTINTKFGEPYFGEIVDNKVELNEIGREVEKQWLLTTSIRPDMNLSLDEFIVMPNHFHGIIGIGPNDYNSFSPSHMDSMHAVRTAQQKGKFGPQSKNLGSIIRGFKSSVTTWCRINHQLFDWHSRYHDIIITDEKMLNKIRKYIRKNPENWKKDRFFI